MPPANDAAPAAPLIIVSPPRDPGFFTGEDDADVEEWIRMFERASTHNRWDDTIMLANLPYHLKDTAKNWYDTNDHTLTSWDVCKEKMRELFGRPVGHQLAARQQLASRAQSSTES